MSDEDDLYAPLLWDDRKRLEDAGYCPAEGYTSGLRYWYAPDGTLCSEAEALRRVEQSLE